MDKALIFVIISALFVAAIYCSSLNAFASTFTDCSYNKSKTKATCLVVDDSGPNTDTTAWQCTKNKSGTWSCTEAASLPPTPDLKNAITGAKSSETAAGAATVGGNNNTSVLEGNVLKHGGALKGGETQNSNDTLQ